MSHVVASSSLEWLRGPSLPTMTTFASCWRHADIPSTVRCRWRSQFFRAPSFLWVASESMAHLCERSYWRTDISGSPNQRGFTCTAGHLGKEKNVSLVLLVSLCLLGKDRRRECAATAPSASLRPRSRLPLPSFRARASSGMLPVRRNGTLLIRVPSWLIG